MRDASTNANLYGKHITGWEVAWQENRKVPNENTVSGAQTISKQRTELCLGREIDGRNEGFKTTNGLESK